MRSDLRHGVREDDPRCLGYSVYTRDGRLVLRSEGFSTVEDVTPLVAGEYRVVAARAGLFLDDPPAVDVVIEGGGAAARVDLRRR